MVDPREHRDAGNPSYQDWAPLAVSKRRCRQVVGLQQMELENLVCPRSLKLISLLFRATPEDELDLFYDLLDPILEEFLSGHIELEILKFVRDQIYILHEKNLRVDDLFDDNNPVDGIYPIMIIDQCWHDSWRKFSYIEAVTTGAIKPQIQADIEFCDKE